MLETLTSPGEAPPGKVWSTEHGHWHDAADLPQLPAEPAADGEAGSEVLWSESLPE